MDFVIFLLFLTTAKELFGFVPNADSFFLLFFLVLAFAKANIGRAGSMNVHILFSEDL